MKFIKRIVLIFSLGIVGFISLGINNINAKVKQAEMKFVRTFSSEVASGESDLSIALGAASLAAGLVPEPFISKFGSIVGGIASIIAAMDAATFTKISDRLADALIYNHETVTVDVNGWNGSVVSY